MAIDNAEKRKSISGLLVVSPGVTPNVRPDVQWRFQVACSYSDEFSTIMPVLYIESTDVGFYASG